MDRNKHLKSAGNIKLIVIVCLCLTMITTACSCGFSAANIPTVTIVAMPSGISAGDISISVQVSNFEVLNGPEESNVSGKGHLIYYMDVPVPTYYYHSAISKANSFAVAYDTTYTWRGVTPGEHTFAVQLVNNDDTPLAAPAVDTITLSVNPPKGNPNVKITRPSAETSLAPGNIAMSVAVENIIISREHMGVINRKGEGHLIYYFDENPPTDQGLPAITDTSVVSAETSYLWKNVKEGKHTFSAQLVNNDDTPFEFPVVETIAVEVAQ